MNRTVKMKSNKKSNALRHKGNKLFAQRMFNDALLKYNESLCNAEDDEHLALAYAKRSAVYMELKLHQQCLNNIKLSKEHKYPEEKLAKLQERESRCLELMMQAVSIDSELIDFFKLSHKANPKIPFIIDDLELKTNAKYGRHIVAKRDLKVGDIISMETAFFKNIQLDPRYSEDTKPSTRFNFCHNCLNENHLDLIPCKNCNATMYCSDECEKSAQSYHKYECEHSEAFQSTTRFTQFRSFFKALAVMNGSIKELEKLFNECLKSPKTIFDFDFSDPNDPEYEKNQLRAALSLGRDKSLKVTPSLDILFDLSPQNKLTWKRHERFIEKFILHLKQVDLCSFGAVQKILSVLAADEGPPRIVIGSGNYLFGALISHSCWPNVKAYTSGNKAPVIVIRPIKAGQQIFTCYDTVFFLAPMMQRRELLYKIWKFNCYCEACSNPLRYQVVMSSEDVSSNYASAMTKTSQELISIVSDTKEKVQEMCETQKFPTFDYLKVSDFFEFLHLLLSQRFFNSIH